MEGQWKRLAVGTVWLLTFGGVGITLMTTGFRILGLALTILGLFLFVYQFGDELRRLRLRVVSSDEEQTYVPPQTEFLWAIVISPFAILIAGYVFFSSGPPSSAVIDNPREVEQLRSELAKLREGHSYTIPQKDEVEFVQTLLSVGQHDMEIAHAEEGEKARALAKRLSTLFVSSGWSVKPLESHVFGREMPPGVIIFVHREHGASSPAAGLLKALLAKQNIDAQIQDFNPSEGGLHTLKVFVGPAPKYINE